MQEDTDELKEKGGSSDPLFNGNKYLKNIR